MSVWVLIPVKPLTRAKSRLSPVLSADERTHLAELMLRRTLHVVTRLPQVAGVLVISRDGRVLSLARGLGAHTIQESGTPELNPALMRATQVLTSWRADAVLILPADIPLVNADDLTNIIRLGSNHTVTVIATDANRDGTNVLFVRPPGLFPYAYGQASFERHQQLARLAGATVHVYDSEVLALDLDTPADLEQYQKYVNEGKYGAETLFLPDLTNGANLGD
jgi:2-phospho-L-lactate/phosphoenolpyruvate guanylyltransferase